MSDRKPPRETWARRPMFAPQSPDLWLAQTHEERMFHAAMRSGTLADYDAWQSAVAYLRQVVLVQPSGIVPSDDERPPSVTVETSDRPSHAKRAAKQTPDR